MISPQGEIVEQLSGDPIDQAIARAQGDRQDETLLWDLVDALQAAKKDARIKAVVLDLDDLRGGGQPTLAEFTAAIKDFRTSGKKVIAHATYYGQEQYYVAAVADEIYLDPMGFVAIDGYDRYRTYYKDLFDKLGVEVNLFRVGAYKSAAEVYVRNDMSPEDREESLQYLNALWLSYRTAVAEAAMNAIEHGNQFDPAVSARVSVSRAGHKLYIRLTDSGKTALREPPAPNLDAKLAGLQSPRGWGLFLIRNMADEVRDLQDDGQHILELTFYLPIEP